VSELRPGIARTWLGIFAILFGALTVFSGWNVLFGSAESRAAAGDVVPFVLWFNFLAGFAYMGTGAGIAAGRSWSAKATAWIAGTTILVFGLFAIHVLTGVAYEMRTVAAMVLRVGFWLSTAIYLRASMTTVHQVDIHS